MKIVSCLIGLLLLVSIAQAQTGQPIPNLQFTQLLNAPTRAASLEQFRGKIVLLDFWATWCAPCVEALPHLAQLQQRFPDQLQVVTITDESPQRIQKFLAKRPSGLWVAIDTANTLSKVFPHQTIPHTVLIGPDSRLIAQTTPGAITESVIDSLIQRKSVHLPTKADNLMTPQEIVKTYFAAADTVKSRFVMQSQLVGASSMHMTHANDATFKNRRLTGINLPLTTLYRIANREFSYKRTIDKTGSTDQSPLYCLDLIVPRPDDLLPTLQRELASRFDTRATIEPQEKEVSILRITDRAKFNQIPRNKTDERTYSARRGAIDQQAVTMADLADYLETYGGGKQLVVDETGNRELLDIKFSYQPEDPGSLTTMLAQMGLGLVKESRSVNMLVLSKL